MLKCVVFSHTGRRTLLRLRRNGVLSYANAAQTTPTTQGSATSSPLYSQGLSTVTGAAQAAPTVPNGARVQNLGSPNSSGIATTSGG